jgi:hypothetical protein
MSLAQFALDAATQTFAADQASPDARAHNTLEHAPENVTVACKHRSAQPACPFCARSTSSGERNGLPLKLPAPPPTGTYASPDRCYRTCHRNGDHCLNRIGRPPLSRKVNGIVMLIRATKSATGKTGAGQVHEHVSTLPVMPTKYAG